MIDSPELKDICVCMLISPGNTVVSAPRSITWAKRSALPASSACPPTAVITSPSTTTYACSRGRSETPSNTRPALISNDPIGCSMIGMLIPRAGKSIRYREGRAACSGDCKRSRPARQTGPAPCLDWQHYGGTGTLLEEQPATAPEESPDECLCCDYPGHPPARLHAQPRCRRPQLTRAAPRTAAGVCGRIRRRGLSQVAGIHARADPLWHTDSDMYAGRDPGILVCRRVSGTRCTGTGLGVGAYLDWLGVHRPPGAWESTAGPALPPLCDLCH